MHSLPSSSSPLSPRLTISEIFFQNKQPYFSNWSIRFLLKPIILHLLSNPNGSEANATLVTTTCVGRAVREMGRLQYEAGLDLLKLVWPSKLYFVWFFLLFFLRSIFFSQFVIVDVRKKLLLLVFFFFFGSVTFVSSQLLLSKLGGRLVLAGVARPRVGLNFKPYPKSKAVLQKLKSISKLTN